MDSSSAFPRGGKSDASSTPTASKKRSLGHRDDLFGSQRTKRIEVSSAVKKKRTLPNLLAGASTAELVVDQVHAVERLKKSSYAEGVLALGYVLQINDSNAIISLPGGLTGTVEYANVSDVVAKLTAAIPGKKRKVDADPPLAELLVTHQPVRCIVLGVTERANSRKTTLALSLRGSLINRGLALKHFIPGFPLYGCIASKEDHGYIISTGISGITCFLPSKAIPASIKVSIGQPIECLVDSVNEAARTVMVSARPNQTSAAVAVGSKLTNNAIVPGMLVNAVINKVLKNGLLVTILDMFTGVVDMISLSKPTATSDISNAYEKGSVVLARVIFADHGSKTIRLSLRPTSLSSEPQEILFLSVRF